MYGLQSAVSRLPATSPRRSRRRPPYTSAPTFALQTVSPAAATPTASRNDVPVFQPQQDTAPAPSGGAVNHLGFGEHHPVQQQDHHHDDDDGHNGGVVVDSTNTGTVTTGHDNTVGDSNATSTTCADPATIPR